MSVRSADDGRKLDILWIRYLGAVRRADKLEERATELDDLAWDVSGEANLEARHTAKILREARELAAAEMVTVRKQIEELAAQASPVEPSPVQASPVEYGEVWLNFAGWTDAQRMELARWVLDPETERAAVDPRLIDLIAKKEG